MDEKLINWTFPAMEMLAEIHEYLSEYSNSAADKYIQELVEYTERLKQHPEACAPCRNPRLMAAGFRCCQVKNHIIIYEVLIDRVNVLAVMHVKRDPRDFEEELL